MAEADILAPDRGSLLDAFAETAARAPPPATVPAAEFLSAGGRVIGAQKIAVPRDERAILQKLRVLAAAAGDEWYYRFPAKSKKTGKTEWIEGGSIKLANEVSRNFGNCEVETRVVDISDSWMIYARFTDYETGYSMTRPFQQRKSQRSIGEDADRQRDIALQIGVSKAIRNVILNALQSISDFAFEEARNALVDKIGRDLPKWRDTTVRKLEAKIDLKRAEAVLGRTAGEWLAPDVAQVVAMMKAVSDGMATLDETFPPLGPPPSEAPAGKLDEFANTDSGAPAQTASGAVEPGISTPDAAAEGAGATPSRPSAAKPSSTEKPA
jgi:hypothetical protein